jgi:hypothetical protein
MRMLRKAMPWVETETDWRESEIDTDIAPGTLPASRRTMLSLVARP